MKLNREKVTRATEAMRHLGIYMPQYQDQQYWEELKEFMVHVQECVGVAPTHVRSFKKRGPKTKPKTAKKPTRAKKVKAAK
jgi:hypothetical protein